MNREDFSPPTPDVQHLPTLFRRIQQGEIRVPAFQRGFVWREAQVIELLESVYRGFPIGSLLFWRVEEELLRVEHKVTFPFPNVPIRYPSKFLLDGLQRLTTLYGVFHWPKPDELGRYNMIFDLDNEEFRLFDGKVQPTRTIHLSSLFSPRDFLEAQRTLSSEVDAEILMEKAIKLHSIFQEYMIPTVTIENRSVADVVSIFERVNSTGTRLNAVDFMRAVTWSESFDLNTELKKVYDEFAQKGFTVKNETLVKTLAIIDGLDPTPSSMLELRQIPPAKLHETMQRLKQRVEEARLFLLEHFAMRSYAYLPYEGQLLALVKFLDISTTTQTQATGEMVKWIWATSFNEELRGKPDHFVTRILDRVADLVAGNASALTTRLNLNTDDLIERRFIRGKALSAAFVCLFAKKEARSIFTGKVIPSALYMRDFATHNFDGLIAVDSLGHVLGKTFPSRKLFASTCLFMDEELMANEHLDLIQKIQLCRSVHKADSESILASQFINQRAADAALSGDISLFLKHRAIDLLQAAAFVVAGRSVDGK